MSKIKHFEDLEIWREAIQIGVHIYKITEEGKLQKDFSAKDQLRRAAISISNNIAEGFEYNNNKSFIRFLLYAKGPAGELRSQLFVLKEAGILDQGKFQLLQDDLLKLSRSIEGFRKYLKNFEKGKQ